MSKLELWLSSNDADLHDECLLSKNSRIDWNVSEKIRMNKHINFVLVILNIWRIKRGQLTAKHLSIENVQINQADVK
ncbi:unnamed protein product [Brachionus calyciflorus]|uniref:Uncharacterized protein n=1 Tax=Brachionus calyciflorus TaxID=104777 RepID=A0A813VPJ4_9BILA|nr:unnamed protein product [Brachionus calyciflorus]